MDHIDALCMLLLSQFDDNSESLSLQTVMMNHETEKISKLLGVPAVDFGVPEGILTRFPKRNVNKSYYGKIDVPELLSKDNHYTKKIEGRYLTILEIVKNKIKVEEKVKNDLEEGVLLGHKGKSLLDAGYIYAPYVPLQMTPILTV